MDPRIREGDEYGGGLTGARASEAKGPFPGGKRVGSWGKKNKRKRKIKSKSPWTAFLTLTHNYPEELLGLKRLAP
jgi:hypothetical protein